MNIAFLGLGAMGSRMAIRLIDAGHRVHVWNRSQAPLTALVSRGAIPAANPREAAAEAGAVFAMVRDDEASRDVWTGEAGALAGMRSDAIAIDCSTLTIAASQTLHARAASRRLDFLEAPVAGSRPQADDGALIFLVGGEAATLARVETVLRTLGRAIHHAGGAGAGATLKLVVNTLFAGQAALMAELLALIDRTPLDAARALSILSDTPVVSASAIGLANAMLEKRWAPAFPIDLVAKDMRAVAAAGIDDTTPSLITTIRQVFEEASRAGLGADNITGIAQRYRR